MAKLIRFSRSWGQRSRSCSEVHGNLVNSTDLEPLKELRRKLTQIRITVGRQTSQFILLIMFLNFVNIKQELLRYMQQNFASFGLLCFAR